MYSEEDMYAEDGGLLPESEWRARRAARKQESFVDVPDPDEQELLNLAEESTRGGWRDPLARDLTGRQVALPRPWSAPSDTNQESKAVRPKKSMTLKTQECATKSLLFIELELGL